MENKYPLRPKEGLQFQLASSDSKQTYVRWNDETKKFETSMSWIKGYSPKFTFDLVDGNKLEVSKDNLAQMLVSAYLEKKKMPELKYYVKTNGKTGKEVRYYFNVAKDYDGTEEIAEQL
jgi:hypothetical protein